MDSAMLSVNANLPDGLPPWLDAFVREALHQTETLRENGADHAATARLALIHKLLAAATAWLDGEIDVLHERLALRHKVHRRTCTPVEKSYEQYRDC